MSILNWFNRTKRLLKRKTKLGEKYTSDFTWRKFSCKQLSNLNPSVDFDTVENIYEIGLCNGKDIFFDKLKSLIKDNKLNTISELNDTVESIQDDLGYIPIGNYLKTYVWIMKDGQIFVQIIKGSFDNNDEEIKFKQIVNAIDIKNIEKRKLIYPI